MHYIALNIIYHAHFLYLSMGFEQSSKHNKTAVNLIIDPTSPVSLLTLLD